jgi:hypothetical protein
VTQDVVVSQGNDNENGGKREDRVKEADLLDENDEQAEVQQPQLDEGLVGVECLK